MGVCVSFDPADADKAVGSDDSFIFDSESAFAAAGSLSLKTLLKLTE